MTKLEQNIDFIFKKTSELNNDEIDQLIKLHNETMNKERSEEEFKEKYLYNFLGFSFHGLMKSNDKIVGCYNVIPYEFVFFSENANALLPQQSITFLLCTQPLVAKKMPVRMKSKNKIRIDDDTTALVVALPTPWAPP